jgi:hypothetical protein
MPGNQRKEVSWASLGRLRSRDEAKDVIWTRQGVGIEKDGEYDKRQRRSQHVQASSHLPCTAASAKLGSLTDR